MEVPLTPMNQMEGEGENVQLLPSVPLPPFQKLVDVPDEAERSRRALCVLAVVSIVLISLILCLFTTAFFINLSVANVASNVLFIFLDIPLMITTFVIVLGINVVSLHNMNKWTSTDACCNLLRSQPACCTKSCGDKGNKHCCARLACAHVGAAILTLVFFLVFVITFAVQGSAINYAKAQNNNPHNYHNYYHSSSNNYYHYYYRSHHNYYSSHHNYQDYYSSSTYYGPSLGALAVFEIPALVLLLVLIATTVRSAWLLRAIENQQPQTVLLPPGKMVEEDGNMMQTTVLDVMAVQTPIAHAVDIPIPAVAAAADDQTQIN